MPNPTNNKIKEIEWSDKEISKGLEDNSITTYIKPLRGIHESGFRVFEVGYCSIKNNRVDKKMIMGSFSDHIWINHLDGVVDYFNLNMDLTLDGYIRLWGHIDKKVIGLKYGLQMSNAMIGIINDQQ